MENQIQNWLTIAETAKKAGNYDEAINYFNKILEVNPKYGDAWLGKGQCSLMKTSLADIKIDEASTYFDMAIENAENKSEIIDKTGRFLSDKLPLIYQLAKDHYKEFKKVKNSKPEFLRRAVWVADTFEKFRNQHNYKEESFLMKGVDIFDAVYLDTIDNRYKDLRKSFEKDLIEVNPSYKPKKGCFIATAVYGNYDNEAVVELRQFREQKLKQTNFGKKFISLYYRFSPPIANTIAKSEILKKITLWTIVIPLRKSIRLIKNKNRT